MCKCMSVLSCVFSIHVYLSKNENNLHILTFTGFLVFEYTTHTKDTHNLEYINIDIRINGIVFSNGMQ